MENRDVLYAKWLSGEISDEVLRAAVGTEEFDKLDRVIKTVDKWSMPKYDVISGYQKFKLKHPVTATKRKSVNWFVIGGIVSLLVLAVLWNVFLSNQNEVITAGNGQNQNIALHDGSEIWINDGSTIEFNEKNWSNDRSIQLIGEALFEVSKGKPFIVNTPNGSIRVLGTQFNVRAWGSNLFVECYEGRVQVEANNQEVILMANEAVNVVQGSMDQKQVITNIAPLWQNATSRFYNENIQLVFDELERQYDIKVQRENSDRKFTGNFKHNDLQSALNAICKPLDLKFTISADQKNVFIE